MDFWSRLTIRKRISGCLIPSPTGTVNLDTFGLDFPTWTTMANTDGTMVLRSIIAIGALINHLRATMRDLYTLQAPTWAILCRVHGTI